MIKANEKNTNKHGRKEIISKRGKKKRKGDESTKKLTVIVK